MKHCDRRRGDQLVAAPGMPVHECRVVGEDRNQFVSTQTTCWDVRKTLGDLAADFIAGRGTEYVLEGALLTNMQAAIAEALGYDEPVNLIDAGLRKKSG